MCLAMFNMEIDVRKLCENLIELVKTPGPTQACVRLSENDPRVLGEFPIEKKIDEIVRKVDTEGDLQVFTHMGNLLVVGGLREIHTPPKEREIQEINDIPVTLGSHLDEITYIVTKKRDPHLGSRLLLPLCNPPKLGIERERRASMIISDLLEPDCRIVGFRSRKFVDDIGTGKIYKIEEEAEEIEEKGRRSIVKAGTRRAEPIYFLNVEEEKENIISGDMVIQDYGPWKGTSKEPQDLYDTLIAKALDDRVGCISCLYAIKELARKKIASKAILTSSEEGVPFDVSWGRLVRSTYAKFCRDDVLSLVCDGMDGKWLEEFSDETIERKHVSRAVIVPYTSSGKGGGDIGVFSLLRDAVIERLKKDYGEDIATLSTDYSSRSYEVRIMDRWTMTGFVQWTCGIPGHPQAVCHNRESVLIKQVVNIIRTLVYATAYLNKIIKDRPNQLFQ